MVDLFGLHDFVDEPWKQNLLPRDGEVYYLPGFFSMEESNHYYSLLLEKAAWQQEKIKMYGKILDVPRLTAWYGHHDKAYTYSGIKMEPNIWLPELLEIKERIEGELKEDFTSVLLNLYRDGQDSVAWHKDDESELGRNPTIASVNFGGTRTFKLRNSEDKNLGLKIELTHGSLLVMKGETQHKWEHAVPKTSQKVKPRINLTFRKIS